MEVLNKNQRESAVWRLIGFGLLVLAANVIILFASYKAFETKGGAGAEDLARQLQECRMKAEGDKHRLQNLVNDKDAQIKTLNDKLKNQGQDQEKIGLKGQIDVLKLQNEDLNKKLDRCQAAASKTN